MICPYCRSDSTVVVDSRRPKEKRRRRYECLQCEKRFTTYENYCTKVLREVFNLKLRETNNGKKEKIPRSKA